MATYSNMPVATAAYNDESYARDLQRKEFARTDPESAPSYYAGYATQNQTQPVYTSPYTATQSSPYNSTTSVSYRPVYGTVPIMSPDIFIGPNEQKLMDTYSLGRGLRILAIIDLIFLIINSLFYTFFLLGIWGPICGYFGASRFKSTLIWFYVGYYMFRIAGDLVLVIYGYWWFILSFMIDLWICRFVYLFLKLLQQCSHAELQQLRNGEPAWRNRNYFYVF